MFFKYIPLSLSLLFPLVTQAAETYTIQDKVSISAPTKLNWKRDKSDEENQITLAHQTDSPPYYTSFLELKISTIDSKINAIEHLLDQAGKKLSRFSIREADVELLESFTYKREHFLEMDCISNTWTTVYPRQKIARSMPTYRTFNMLECPIPNTSQILSLSFMYSGKEHNIPPAMQKDAKDFFNSLTLHAAKD